MSTHDLVRRAEEAVRQVHGMRITTSDVLLELQGLVRELQAVKGAAEEATEATPVDEYDDDDRMDADALDPAADGDPVTTECVPTLEDAINAFIAGTQTPQGAVCPCCSRHYEAKRRWLNAPHARVLIHLVRYTQDEMEHNRKSFGQREVAARLASDGYPWFPTNILPPLARKGRLGEMLRFGVLELSGRRNKQMWRVTPRAVAFVEDKTSIPTAVLHIGPTALRLDNRKTIEMALQGTQKAYDYEDCLTEPLFKFPENGVEEDHEIPRG